MTPQHCTSQPLSRRLAAAGVKQESEFYWIKPHESSKWECWNPGERKQTLIAAYFDLIPAFLASELLEMLPVTVETEEILGEKLQAHVWLNKYLSDGNIEYICGYGLVKFSASTPSEALGEMLLHLITNGLIDPKGI